MHTEDPFGTELLTTDMKAAEKFYSTVVGWTVKPFGSAEQPYDIFNRAGEVGIGGVMKIPPGMNFPPHWIMYVAVDRHRGHHQEDRGAWRQVTGSADGRPQRRQAAVDA